MGTHLLRQSKGLLFLIAYLCPFVWALGQSYEKKRIDVNTNGQSKVMQKKLYIDKDNFVWYSTFNGLVKEMGGNSILYSYPGTKFPDTYTAFTILKTNNDHVWVCADTGTYFFDLKTGQFEWIDSSGVESEDRLALNSIVEDVNDILWFGSFSNYIYKFTYENGFRRYSIGKPEGLETNAQIDTRVVDILDDRSLLVEQNGKFYQFVNGEISLLKDLSPQAKSNIQGILCPNGVIFPGGSSGSYEYEGKKYQFYYVKQIDKQLVEVPFHSQHTKWVQGNKYLPGVQLVAGTGEDIQLLRFKKENNKWHLLAVEQVPMLDYLHHLEIDRFGYVWISTDNGIEKIHYTQLPFNRHLSNYRDYGLTGRISCRSPVEDSQGNIYIYTYSGFFKKQKGTESFEPFLITHHKDGTPFANYSYNIFMQDDQTLWSYGYHSNLYRIDIPSQTYTVVPVRDHPNKDRLNFFDMEPYGDQKVLLSSNLGLFEFDLKTYQFKDIGYLNEDHDIRNKRTFDILVTKDQKTVWFGVENSGLYVLEPDNNQIRHLTTETTPVALPSNNIRYLYESHGGALWVATESGLLQLNRAMTKAKVYTQKQGLKNDKITGILETQDELWMGTYSGLVKFIKKDETFEDFYVADGLTENEFNTRSSLQASDSTFYFGGINGLVQFDPSKIDKPKRNPKIYLSKFEAYNAEIDSSSMVTRNIDSVRSFSIPYDQNYLKLHFGLNDLFNPDKNIYLYRISGLTNDWITNESNNTIQLFGLEPNDYILEVKGFSADGTPTNILEYDISVRQIFYKKRWFIALTIALILSAIMIWHYYRRRIIRRHFRHKAKYTQLESKALRAQMNPHFIFNALNGIQSVMILKGEAEANKYVASFSRLLRLTMDMTNSEYISVQSEFEYIVSYLNLEKLRLNNNLDFIIETPNESEVEGYSIPCMLFQPVIENSIIHGLTPKKGDRLLKVKLTLEDDMLIGVVHDNGIGREAAAERNRKRLQKHKSWATSIMNERIDIANSINHKKIDFEVFDLRENGYALGTKTVLRIPLTKTQEI
ncbi:MAG: histidine kinase [Bacteroidota bacterium]